MNTMDTPWRRPSCSTGAPRILLVDDAQTDIALISGALQGMAVCLTVASTVAEAHTRLAEFQPDLAIVDLLLPDGKGTDLLSTPGEEAPFPVIVMTCHGNEQEAVSAIKAGALDYLTKSADTLANLSHIVERTLREWRHITERRLAEAALRESEERFRSFFVSSPAGLVILSPEGGFLQVNPAHCRLLGYDEDEMLRLRVSDITHPADRRSTQHLYDELLAVRRPLIEYEKRYLRKDGSILWGHVTVAGVYDAQHALLYLVGQMQDITEHKRAEEALRESEERFRLVFTNAAAGMVIVSPNGRIQQANPAACRFAGRSETELEQLSIEDVTHPEDRETTSGNHDETWAATLPGVHFEKRYLRKDGQVVWGHASLACVMDANSQPAYCVGLVQDITERKQMEEELRRANRELDAFVHTVSHDLRSPLTPIIGFTDFLMQNYRDRLDERAMEILAMIQQQGDRMHGMLEDLLALATAGQLQRPDEPVACSEVVEEVVLGLANKLLPAEVAIEKKELPSLRVPKTVLAQLFDNLIGNALRYAGKEGSPIEVGGERLGDRVRYYVRDHGPGIPEAERSRIFDLFYRGSTGGKVSGTGVGLATVHKIARLYGGQAWVEETPGGGSTFMVEMADAGPPAGKSRKVG